MAIIDTDLADVAEWNEVGELVFKSSSDLTAEQKVAVSEIIEERTKLGKTLKVRLYDKMSAMAHVPSCSICLLIVTNTAGRTAGRSRSPTTGRGSWTV